MSLLRKLFATSTKADRGAGAVAVATKASRGDAAKGSERLADERNGLVAKVEAHVAAGGYVEALALIDDALVTAPDDPELLFARASTLFEWGRVREALDGYLRAERKGLGDEKLHRQLGWCYFYTGNPEAAESRMHKAITLAPDAFTAHIGLAWVLHARKRLDEAAASYERALQLRPDAFDCLIMLGGCNLDRSDPLAAEASFRRAISVDDERATGWTNLGVAFSAQNHEADALEAFEHAARLEAKNAEDVDNFVNLAISLKYAGRIQDALDMYENNLSQRPTVDGYTNYAITLLLAGRLIEGWTHYEFRWLKDPLLSVRPDFHRPVWAGQPLHGKTILLRGEQGFGDHIQFARYAPLIKVLGATVLLQVRAGLEELAQGFSGVDRVLGSTEFALPEFDFCIHLLSLPRVLGTDLASIPVNVPYLRPQPAQAEQWAPRLGANGVLKVGLVWAGNPSHLRDRERTLTLQLLAPLLDVEGTRFFSLQKGAEVEDALPTVPGFVNLGPELEDFSDTAAVISQLDLVISIDTAVAHLAGALGKPVWLLLPTPADWRWLEGREDSPWYPTMRLFRQSRRGEWGEVVDRVKAALQERLRQQTTAPVSPIDSARNTVAVPKRSLESKLDTVPLRPPGLSAVAETRLGILQYFPGEVVVGESIGWYGELLQLQLNLLARLIKPGTTVMEVSAGVGMHALFLAAAVGPTGHLFLYEPRPVVQRVLRQNLGANRVTNVTVMKGSLQRLGRNGPAGASDSIGVATETLDELRLERLELLKITDGDTALDVLDGAADTLWRLRPMLFLGAPDEPMLTRLAHRAKEFSYRCWRTESALFTPENFNRRDTDIFAGGTALALLAIPEEVEVDIPLEGCVEL